MLISFDNAKVASSTLVVITIFLNFFFGPFFGYGLGESKKRGLRALFLGAVRDRSVGSLDFGHEERSFQGLFSEGSVEVNTRHGSCLSELDSIMQVMQLQYQLRGRRVYRSFFFTRLANWNYYVGRKDDDAFHLLTLPSPLLGTV